MQVTAGISPGSNVATRTALCAYRADGVQYACDTGCCPTDCTVSNSFASPDTAGGTSTDMTILDYILVTLAIIFCILLILGVVWASRKRKNLG